MDGSVTSVDEVDETYGSVGDDTPRPRPRWRKKRWAFPGIAVFVLLVVFLIAWANRTSIATDIIEDQLTAFDIPATYTVERIGPRTQVLADVVIGNPADPDFTARRAIVRLKHRLGLPSIGSIELVEPRIYGTFADGRVSFGSLDSLIYRETEGSTGLPDIDLAIRDGRGRMTSDYGAVGFKLQGEGNLSGGFSGILAATAPGFEIGECSSRSLTAYGTIESDGGIPQFSGPLRARGVSCGQDLSLTRLDAQIDMRSEADFSQPRFTARIEAGGTRVAIASIEGLTGTVRGSASAGNWALRYNLVSRGLETPQVLVAAATVEGQARSLPGGRSEISADIDGGGLRLGSQPIRLLSNVERSTRNTFVAPLAARLTGALRSQTRGSSLLATVRYRSSADGHNIVVPRAEITGGSGERILSLSRVEVAANGSARPAVTGNLALAGTNLPRLSGRMERASNGSSVFRLSMERYAAGRSELAVPDLVLAQSPDGSLSFRGDTVASGPLPGGTIENLRLPVSGRLSASGTLALWDTCVRPRFDSLSYANLALEGRGITVCPAPGLSILTYGDAGLRFAAGMPALDLAGTLGETPIRVATGAVGLAYPGVLRAAEVDVALGPVARPMTFRISNLDARLGESLGGTFAGADVTLPSVPLDIEEAAGEWTYSNGELALSEGQFRLLDRQEEDRFKPLIARKARLSLRDNIIVADGAMRDPGSDRVVTDVAIRHDISTGAGHADLTVPGLLFDDELQPVQLTRLALGVVANVRGIVAGTGRIDWSPSGAVTSTGSFSSDDLDFAAAFGPVQGASGTIVFSDLLGLTTAPNQRLRVASINPGIEVLDGEVAFALRNGEVLAVEGGTWPFMGGRLVLREVDLNIGQSEERRYVFEIVGLEAAQFVAQLELENIAATGIFDGTVPIVFDRNGDGRIEGGLLVSREPGGNLSYVGELTYEDLSPIANFAFDALRSLDYTQMTVAMDGPLTGEIVTRVRFDGVSQGEGAKRNFITRRLAALPLQFRINLRAPFYKLITSLKSLYDPSAVRDPRALGLVSDDGTRLLREQITGDEIEQELEADDLIPDTEPVDRSPAIQSQESEGAS